MKRADLDTRTVLAAVRDHGTGAYGHLADRFPAKIVVAAFEREVRARRLECGVNVTLPFLEPDGWRWLEDRSGRGPEGCQRR